MTGLQSEAASSVIELCFFSYLSVAKKWPQLLWLGWHLIVLVWLLRVGLLQVKIRRFRVLMSLCGKFSLPGQHLPWEYPAGLRHLQTGPSSSRCAQDGKGQYLTQTGEIGKCSFVPCSSLSPTSHGVT